LLLDLKLGGQLGKLKFDSDERSGFMLPVAILAGGLGTRLGALTESIPKSMVNVAGKPFIARQLDYLREQGLSRVVLCIGHFGAQIREFVGTGLGFGIEVSYSEDGSSLLGTGGALRRASQLLGDHFFVLYGDSFLPVDFFSVQQAYQLSGKQALMTVLKNESRWDKSNALFVDGQLIEYNKHATRAEMNYIDYGLGVLSASILKQLPSTQYFDLADVYQDLSAKGKLAGLEVHQRFYEIGSHSGLKETEEYFLTKEKV
jgi:NDP-sugar pyrophosphorylase family protein